MKLELWRPLIDIEKELDSLFRLPRSLSERVEFPFRPSIDVDRENGELIVSAELPGIDPDKDIEVTLDDDYLTIKGEKSEDKEISEDDRYMHERSFGKFVRRIPVPEGVSPDKIEADYAKGVLTVKVTLPEETKLAEPQKIPVGAKEG
ncbi:MAG: Hsp20/alpha crystallin family protein [Actinomycetota bacterium]